MDSGLSLDETMKAASDGSSADLVLFHCISDCLRQNEPANAVWWDRVHLLCFDIGIPYADI